jgi:hypothetical protein
LVRYRLNISAAEEAVAFLLDITQKATSVHERRAAPPRPVLRSKPV